MNVRKVFDKIFLKLLYNFIVTSFKNYLCKKVYPHEFIVLLERGQYLSKIPKIGLFSIISYLQNTQWKIDKICLWFKNLTFISFHIYSSLNHRGRTRGIQTTHQITCIHMSSKYISSLFCRIPFDFETCSV